MLNEILEIHDELQNRLGVVTPDRLAQLSSAVMIATSLHRVANAIEKQDEKN